MELRCSPTLLGARSGLTSRLASKQKPNISPRGPAEPGDKVVWEGRPCFVFDPLIQTHAHQLGRLLATPTERFPDLPNPPNKCFTEFRRGHAAT